MLLLPLLGAIASLHQPGILSVSYLWALAPSPNSPQISAKPPRRFNTFSVTTCLQQSMAVGRPKRRSEGKNGSPREWAVRERPVNALP